MSDHETLDDFVNKIVKSFEEGYECSFNLDHNNHKFINFETSEYNKEKLELDNGYCYHNDTNISNFHTHPNNIDNLLSFVPSELDITLLITTAYEYNKQVKNDIIKETILCSRKEDDKTIFYYLEYYIDEFDRIEEMFINRWDIGNIFNNIAYDYINYHKDFDKFIENYKNSNLTHIIKLKMFRIDDNKTTNIFSL